MSWEHWDQEIRFLQALGKDVLHGKGREEWDGLDVSAVAGLDVPALAGPTACNSDKYKWQLQIQAVAIAPS